MSEPQSRRRLALGSGSARDVLVATVVAGGSGYIITVAAGSILGNPGYLPFAAFWSALYLIVGALAGVQHETSRAARPVAEHSHPGTSARSIFLITSSAAVVLLAGSAYFWVPRVFEEHGSVLLAPILAGAVGYLAICVAAGVLAGLASWRLLALVTIVDSLTRLVIVAVALAFTRDPVILAWCVAAPFGVAGLGAAWFVTRIARGRYTIAEPLPVFAWNATRTVVSGAAMGMLITGFPALLAASTSDEQSSRVTAIIFVSNLARSPLIVLTMSFQVLLVQRLRDGASSANTVARLLAAITAAGAIFTIAVVALGPWALDVAFGGEYSLSRGELALIVISAVPAAAMFVTGAALLARGRHTAYVAGWVAAAATVVVALAVGLPLLASVAAAVLGAPVVGLAVHGWGAWRNSRTAGVA